MVERVRYRYHFEFRYHHGYSGNARLVRQMRCFEELVGVMVEAGEMAGSDGIRMVDRLSAALTWRS